MIKIEKHEKFVDGERKELSYWLINDVYDDRWILEPQELEQLRQAINNLPKE